MSSTLLDRAISHRLTKLEDEARRNGLDPTPDEWDVIVSDVEREMDRVIGRNE